MTPWLWVLPAWEGPHSPQTPIRINDEQEVKHMTAETPEATEPEAVDPEAAADEATDSGGAEQDTPAE